jgi:transcription antitermination factor NusA-like protein
MILFSLAMYVHPSPSGWLLTDTCRIKSVEFEIDREYVGRVVGSQGSGVNRLRESLGVKIDFSDDGDDIKDAFKKKKGTAQRSKITVRKSSSTTQIKN